MSLIGDVKPRVHGRRFGIVDRRVVQVEGRVPFGISYRYVDIASFQ